MKLSTLTFAISLTAILMLSSLSMADNAVATGPHGKEGMIGMTTPQGDGQPAMGMMPMMQQRQAMMQEHMDKMETHMANMEKMLTQLVEEKQK